MLLSIVEDLDTNIIEVGRIRRVNQQEIFLVLLLLGIDNQQIESDSVVSTCFGQSFDFTSLHPLDELDECCKSIRIS